MWLKGLGRLQSLIEQQVIETPTNTNQDSKAIPVKKNVVQEAEESNKDQDQVQEKPFEQTREEEEAIREAAAAAAKLDEQVENDSTRKLGNTIEDEQVEAHIQDLDNLVT